MQCRQCPTSCASVKDYLNHCKIHGPKIPCCTCQLWFSGRNRFYEHYKTHTTNIVVSDPVISNILKCSHCTESFHTYNDFRIHVQKLYPVTLIDCPCCGKRKLPSYDSFRLHYFREHKDYLSEKPQPDVQNVEELQTAHNDSFSGSEDEDMPLCNEDTTLRQEREMLKIDLVAKLMLIQGKHGMPQGMIFKLQRSLLSI